MADTPQVFLSYAREDRARAEQIYTTLSGKGFRPWMDIRDLRPGSNWQISIEEAIRNSDYFLILLSNNSISKQGYLQVEVRAALSLLLEKPTNEVFLIPVRLDDSPFPQALAHIQSVDLFEKDGWQKLLNSLEYGAENTHVAEEFRGAVEGRKKAGNSKPHIFVAMPFRVEMEDVFHYAIQQAVNANGFLCERVDLSAFTGSILQYVKEKIETAAAVIADLTGENPNVHIELGYAWGKGIPTILIVQNVKDLCFDVRDQRYIEYRSIQALELSLTQELARLKATGNL